MHNLPFALITMNVLSIDGRHSTSIPKSLPESPEILDITSQV